MELQPYSGIKRDTQQRDNFLRIRKKSLTRGKADKQQDWTGRRLPHFLRYDMTRFDHSKLSMLLFLLTFFFTIVFPFLLMDSDISSRYIVPYINL